MRFRNTICLKSLAKYEYDLCVFIFSSTNEVEKMDMVIRMPALFISNPIEIDHRLSDLGWTRKEMLEIIDAMVSARYSCTENDPTSAPGWMAWKEGTRRMRELGRRHGFENSDEDQIPWLCDTSRGRRFSVANTNDATGHEHRLPQNRNRKGAATDRVVAENEAMLFNEAELPEMVKPLNVARPNPGMVQSWYLCVNADGDSVTAELSCPVAIEGGYFVGFHERIVLIAPGEDGPDVTKLTDGDPGAEDFDIPVSKKS